MRHYCTYFDGRYADRARALIHSLDVYGGDYTLHALCLDAAALDRITRLSHPRVRTIRLEDVEPWDPALSEARANRSKVEFVFTLSPILPLYVFSRFPEIEQLTYLDADLFFFDSPEAVFQEIGPASVAIVPHRFSPQVREKAEFGIYNVGWITFRRDEHARECLNWWRERCLERCPDHLVDGCYADQKYLDSWPERFNGVHVIQHPGANLGPWNLNRHRLTLAEGGVLVDDRPLIFYHFSSFLPVASWLLNTNLAYWKVRPNRLVRRHVIEPYLAALRDTRPSECPGTRRRSDSRRPESGWARICRKFRAVRVILTGLFQGDHLVVIRGHVL